MTRRFWQTIGIGSAVAIGVGVLAPTVAGANVVCGQVVNASLTLNHDLQCPQTALFVTAPGVVVNLGGHTISGPAPVGANSFHRGISTNQPNVSVLNGTIRGFDRGIHVGFGANNILLSRLTLDGNGLGIGSDLGTTAGRIVGNTIVSTVFFSAIQLGGNGHRVEANTITSPRGAGILYSGNDNLFRGNRISEAGSASVATSTFGGNNPGPHRRNQILGNTLTGNARVFNNTAVSIANGSGTLIHGNTVTGRRSTPGILLDNSAGTVVTSNAVREHSTGITVRNGSSGTQVRDNRAADNRFSGIFVEATAPAPTGTTIEGNTAAGNGSNGIDVNSPSTTITANTAYNNANLGIWAVNGVTDGGGNHAFGNGNPAQCSPTIAC